MFLFETSEIIQIIAWGLALIEFIVGVYIFALNPWSRANRRVGILMIIVAINSYAIGALTVAQVIAQAHIPSILIAITTPMAQPGLLIVTIVLLKEEWLRGPLKYFRWVLFGIFFSPVVLTLLDIFAGTQFWFTGIDSVSYQGGYIVLSSFTQGTIANGFRILTIFAFSIIVIIPQIYCAFFEKKQHAANRRLAYILLATQILALVINFTLIFTIHFSIALLATSAVFVLGYGYATFTQLLSERHLQRGRLQPRLTTLILVIAIPLLIVPSTFVVSQAGEFIRSDAIQDLENTNQTISETIEAALFYSINALDAIIELPAVQSMDQNLQRPILESVEKSFEHIYLVSTIGLDGINVTRSDGIPNKDYSDRDYVKQILAGEEIVFQILIGKTSEEPSLVIAKPILDSTGELVGIGMLASTVEIFNTTIELNTVGETGIGYIIDQNNRVLIHPDRNLILEDFSANPAVAALRQNGGGDLVKYTDENHETWVANVQTLENGWAVVVQQKEIELLGPLNAFQSIVWVAMIFGTILLGGLTTLAIRQAISPIETLTSTATAITQGDLTRIAPIVSEDEIGILAKSFNQMTEQLLESISTLEQRVSNRTQDLEKRSEQLQAAADVSRAASSLLDVNQLLQEVVEVIREQFNLYYAGLFLVDQSREWAQLRAGSGEAGQKMLARQHRIQIGQGMIGWSIANAESRIALEAGEDAVRLATEELPETRSEAALPLRVRGQIIGALTIQDSEPDSFDDASIAILQTMADLVSVAIDNANLYTQTQEALVASQRAYGEVSDQAWAEALGSQKALGFRSNEQGVIPADSQSAEIELEAIQAGKFTQINADGDHQLAIPIKVRDMTIGVLNTYKSTEAGKWAPEELQMVQTIIDQLGVALEGARLYRDTQQRAIREQIIGEITTRLRSTLNIETILQTAVNEIYETLPLDQVSIRLSDDLSNLQEEPAP
jgi:GAF domain-containing protein/HAMP domain-containing protein